MQGYTIIPLSELVVQLGEDKAKEVLSSFSCPLNKDVERFLKTKSIEFSKQGLARTHLVFAQYKDESELLRLL